MISIRQAKSYCRDDISLIENYAKAIADTTQTWVCHHRDGVKILPSGMTVIRSRQDLKDAGRYYGCPANELIFLTKYEHDTLHTTVKKGKTLTGEHRRKISEAARRQFADPEQRKKMSDALKGRPGYWVGKHRSDETKQKVSDAVKAYWTRRKLAKEVK